MKPPKIPCPLCGRRAVRLEGGAIAQHTCARTFEVEVIETVVTSAKVVVRAFSNGAARERAMLLYTNTQKTDEDDKWPTRSGEAVGPGICVTRRVSVRHAAKRSA